MQDIAQERTTHAPCRRFSFITAVLSFSLLTIACDAGTAQSVFPAPLADGRASITPDKARAANALSIVNAAPPPQADAYGNALQCAAAVNTVTDRLRQRSLATPEVLGEMDRFARLYERSLLDIAAEEDRNRPQTIDELERTRAFMAQRLPETGRTAMACIRERANAQP